MTNSLTSRNSFPRQIDLDYHLEYIAVNVGNK